MRPGRGDGLLTTAEAARLAGVSVNTIYTWRNRGHLVAQGLQVSAHAGLRPHGQCLRGRHHKDADLQRVRDERVAAAECYERRQVI